MWRRAGSQRDRGSGERPAAMVDEHAQVIRRCVRNHEIQEAIAVEIDRHQARGHGTLGGNEWRGACGAVGIGQGLQRDDVRDVRNGG